MHKIKDFSVLSKTTIKALRYYEKEKLLIPHFIDSSTKYRFYETNQLVDLAFIVSLRQIGISIKMIKAIKDGQELKNILIDQKDKIEKEISIYQDQLLRINYLLEGKNMKYEVVLKTLPDYVIYYKEGTIKDFSHMTEFILSSSDDCKKTNPNIKCIEPDYCFINYLDGEHKNRDIKIRYSQAVTEMGIENETIKFQKLKEELAICIYHKGSYDKLGDAYSFIVKWIEENDYEIIDLIRERYIDGIWNKENMEDWLTEIQVPVKKK